MQVSPWAASVCTVLVLTACGGNGSSPGTTQPPLACTAPQVPNANGTACVDPAVPPGNVQVTDVQTVPASPQYGEPFALTVTGKGLPDTLFVTLPGCTFAAQAGGASTSRSYTCTPRKTGPLMGTVAASTGGAQPKTFEVTVNAPKQTLTDTGIGTSASCFKAGTSDLVDCTSADATDLNDQQDGMTGLDATNGSNSDGKLGFRYTKLGANGADLPAGATAWACLRDNVTGLVWEVKTPANAGDGYSYSAAQAYQGAVNAVGLCGATDWRVPSVQELTSLKDYSASGPAVHADTLWLGETVSGPYWSSTQDAQTPAVYRWAVDFSSTYSGIDPVTINYAVRLVRGTVPSPTTRYTPLFDGSELRDNFTGLVWRRCVEGMAWDGGTNTCTGIPLRLTHGQALARAKAQTALARANQEVGWRMPNIKELFSMVDTSKAGPAVDGAAFPGKLNTGGSWNYWSSTPVPDVQDAAMTVRFDNGGVEMKFRLDDPGSSTNKTVGVRLVRYFP